MGGTPICPSIPIPAAPGKSCGYCPGDRRSHHCGGAGVAELGVGFTPAASTAATARRSTCAARAFRRKGIFVCASSCRTAKYTGTFPSAGAVIDCESTAIVLTSLTEKDVARLAFFPALAELDLTAADVSPERFDAVRAAYPALSVRWSIPIGASRYPSDAESITADGLHRFRAAAF